MTAYQLITTQLSNIGFDRIWISDGERAAGWLYKSKETEAMKMREVVDVTAHFIGGEVIFNIIVE